MTVQPVISRKTNAGSGYSGIVKDSDNPLLPTFFLLINTASTVTKVFRAISKPAAIRICSKVEVHRKTSAIPERKTMALVGIPASLSLPRKANCR